MNFVSEKYPEIEIHEWACDLNKEPQLEYLGLLHHLNMHFLFKGSKGIYVISVKDMAPYKIIQEKLNSETTVLFHNITLKNAWKITNSPFVNKIDSQGIFFFDAPQQNKFQYLIRTNTMNIEFISQSVSLVLIPKKTPSEVFLDLFKKEQKDRLALEA